MHSKLDTLLYWPEGLPPGLQTAIQMVAGGLQLGYHRKMCKPAFANCVWTLSALAQERERLLRRLEMCAKALSMRRMYAITGQTQHAQVYT